MQVAGWGEHILLAPKYLDQFLMILHATFTAGLVFVRQLKRGQPYVLIETTPTPKYLDQFLMALLTTFTTGMFSFWSKHRVAAPCFNCLTKCAPYVTL